MTEHITAEQAIALAENYENMEPEDGKALSEFIRQKCTPVEDAEVRETLDTIDRGGMPRDIRSLVERLARERDEANTLMQKFSDSLHRRTKELTAVDNNRVEWKERSEQQAAEIEKLRKKLKRAGERIHGYQGDIERLEEQCEYTRNTVVKLEQHIEANAEKVKTFDALRSITDRADVDCIHIEGNYVQVCINGKADPVDVLIDHTRNDDVESAIIEAAAAINAADTEGE